MGAAIGAVALILIPTVFQPYIFPLFKLFDESARIATAFGVAAFACMPLHAYSISSITGVLRSGGDVTWATVLDVGPQWLMAIPLTALLALVWQAGPFAIAFATHAEAALKVPLSLLRVAGGKWVHDVTMDKEDV